jgi:site-specific DNA recombinase
MLLSFAQFEREVIGERIRDKFEASRKRGMWMGGWTPLGYDVKDRKLVINAEEAALVRDIFTRFARFKSGTRLVQQLTDEGKRNKQGKPIDKGYLYKLLHNRVYLGEAVHKGKSYPGEHEAIISQELWDEVRSVLKESPRARAGRSRAQTPALLRGLIYGPAGEAMTPSHTRKRGRLYRYYISTKIIKNGASGDPVSRLPAAEIEAAVIDQVRRAVKSPSAIVATWKAAKTSRPTLKQQDVRHALRQFDEIWEELFPLEQQRLVSLIVDRIEVDAHGANIKLKNEGILELLMELSDERQAAA